MPITLEQIIEETRQWSDEAVAELIDRIMLVRHGVEDDNLDPEMRAELRRRAEEIRSGKEKGIPGEVVLARTRKIVGRKSREVI